MEPQVNLSVKIANSVVRNAVTNEEVKMESFWEESPCVIIFFRRFGCVFCRYMAKEISELSPILLKNNVRFIGVGFDQLGVTEFIEGGYFAGELHLDPYKITYKAVGHKVHSYFEFVTCLFDKKIHSAFANIRKKTGITGNFQGDYYQNGGALVIDSKVRGSKVLLSFNQENPVDTVKNCDVLKVLDISP